ncbi:MAG: hypothetical protein ACXWJZ_01485 [Burkholderiaceae bacterium]
MTAKEIYDQFSPMFSEVPEVFQPGCRAILKQAVDTALPEKPNSWADCIMQGKNLQPIEYKVIVLPDLVEETDDSIKSAKSLGIVFLEKDADRDKLKQVSGTLVSVGGNAFDDMLGLVPKVGDKVYYAKYAGLILKADDGTDFRMMNDKDITAVLV